MTDLPPRPNIVLVVMDCVRAFDFPPGASNPTTGEFLSDLRSESVVYSHSVTVSPWTLPAHGSMLTGLYPWDHHLHSRDTLYLPEGITTLAQRLAPAGYRSLLLSANYLVSPDFGIGRGFDATAWGGWWEPFLRSPDLEYPPRAEGLDHEQRPSLERVRSGPVWSAVKLLSPSLMNHYAVLDSVNQTAHWLRSGRRDPMGIPVASWLEPTFDRWLTGQDASDPIFAVVNLLDAHEPYGSNPSDVTGARQTVRYLRLRQDSVDLNSGAWKAGPRDIALLQSLYRTSIQMLTRRLKHLVSTLKARGRWENTLFLLTSDHGQALGEQGTFYHMHHINEACLRIPMWVRFPGASAGGTQSASWTSPIDIVPTALGAAGIDPVPGLAGEDMATLVAHPRRAPPFVVLDGLGLARGDSRLRKQLGHLDRVAVGVYHPAQRLILDSTHPAPRAFRQTDELGPDEEIPVDTSPSTETLVREAQRILTVMSATTRKPGTEETLQRLASWGYA